VTDLLAAIFVAFNYEKVYAKSHTISTFKIKCLGRRRHRGDIGDASSTRPKKVLT